MLRQRLGPFAAALLAWLCICISLYAAVPKYADVFDSFGAESPLITTLVTGMFLTGTRMLWALAVGSLIIMVVALLVPVARARMVAMALLLALTMFAALCPLVFILPMVVIPNYAPGPSRNDTLETTSPPR